MGREALAKGDGATALQLLLRKHELVLEAFGPEGVSTGTSLIDLSQAYHLLRRYREAREAIQSAFEIYQHSGHEGAGTDRLEAAMIETCTMQGHSFEVERISKARIARLDALGAERELDRAITQDNLARLYSEQRRTEEAIPLLRNSVEIFDRLIGELDKDTGICCLYLSRALLALEQWQEAEHYARRALACARSAGGETSVEAAMAADECAVAVAFSARETNSAQKAHEAIDLSEWALRIFEAEQGPQGKATLVSRDNNHKLKLMLSQTVSEAAIPAPVRNDHERPLVVPSYPFISHSYADKAALSVLLAGLPSWCKPIVFEPITVPPSEFVSEKLISGILGATGLIFIDSPISTASFWTTFERDLAARKMKPMLRFDAETKQLSHYEVQPRKLMVAHLYHPDDAADVNKIMRWLVDERSFEAFDDARHPPSAQIPPFARQEADRRDAFLFSIRSYGAIYLIFLSPKLLGDEQLRAHALEQVSRNPHTTLICWLEPHKGLWPPKPIRLLKRVPKDRSFSFGQRPTHPKFSANELDDLSVRLFWVLHQNPGGVVGAQASG